MANFALSEDNPAVLFDILTHYNQNAYALHALTHVH